MEEEGEVIEEAEATVIAVTAVQRHLRLGASTLVDEETAAQRMRQSGVAGCLHALWPPCLFACLCSLVA